MNDRNRTKAILLRSGARRWACLAILSAPAIAVPAAAADPAVSWAGSYAYEHDGGRTAGGSPIVVTYRLDIAPHRANRSCLLRIEGFQFDQTIVCKLDGSADAVAVRFHVFGDGRVVNAYGTRIYDVGAALFGLARPDPEGPIRTDWRALTPGEGTPAAGSYFSRSK